MKKKYLYIHFLLVLITLILEILPYSYVMNFRPAPEKTVRVLCSFFSPVTFGYGDFGTFAAAIFTAILFVLSVFYMKWQGKALLNWIRVISGLAAVSLGTSIIFIGFASYTAVGLTVDCLLLVIFIVSLLKRDKEKECV